MFTSRAVIDAPPPAKRSVVRVWDRLWQSRASDAKDDALIARERRNPRWALITEQLEAAFGSMEGLRTIELGSGRGDLSVLLAERGAHVTLLDASDAALDQARHRFGRLGLTPRYEKADMRDGLDAWRDRFDVALSSGVIEHYRGEQRTGVVAAHRAVLRGGGMAIISVPHAWCVPYRVWKFYLELRGWWPYGLEIPYTRRELAARARQAGLLEARMHCMGFWQSIGSHWISLLLDRRPDWIERRSVLDACMGATLLMFARREGGDRFQAVGDVL